tara:strand:- start:906 stop:1028 length:123 start_codon:yes stop_codon:yes gene_type:complete
VALCAFSNSSAAPSFGTGYSQSYRDSGEIIKLKKLNRTVN